MPTEESCGSAAPPGPKLDLTQQSIVTPSHLHVTHLVQIDADVAVSTHATHAETTDAQADASGVAAVVQWMYVGVALPPEPPARIQHLAIVATWRKDLSAPLGKAASVLRKHIARGRRVLLLSPQLGVSDASDRSAMVLVLLLYLMQRDQIEREAAAPALAELWPDGPYNVDPRLLCQLDAFGPTAVAAARARSLDAGREARDRLSEVVPGSLYISNFRTGSCVQTLSGHGIRVVYNLTEQAKTASVLEHMEAAGVAERRIHLEDTLEADVVAVVQKVAKTYDPTVPTVVHCHAGVSRSVAVAVCLLVLFHQHRDYDDALTTIRRVRPIAQPNPAFDVRLRAYLHLHATHVLAAASSSSTA